MNNKERLYLDIHAIQTLPPSNINRDDTGSPKTAQYGGVRRARVSSQSWKRAMRQYFIENGNVSKVGVRTLEIVEYVADKIIELEGSLTKDDAIEMSKKLFSKSSISITKENKTKALFFLGNKQAELLAKAAIEGNNDKETINEILNTNPAIDIALFGRMLADDPSLNEDASSQVAHAISTHGVQPEFDFFTAIDDYSTQNNAGAGMLGTVEFNSSTLYRYANVSVHDLLRQLKDKEQVIQTLKLFIEAFSNSLPTGKINTFANQTLPQVLIISLRNDRPINLVSAFENPVKSKMGFAEESIVKLSKEMKRVSKFANEPIISFYVSMEEIESLKEIGTEVNSLKSLLEEIEVKLNELV